jgi:hypothetical protein
MRNAMSKIYGWIENGNTMAPYYDFIPNNNWTMEELRRKQKEILSDIESLDLGKRNSTIESWLALISALPETLCRVLINELKLNNHICSLSSENWPNNGSIVVRLANRFASENHEISSNLIWREVNDSHYCIEEISERENNIEHLLIY